MRRSTTTLLVIAALLGGVAYGLTPAGATGAVPAPPGLPAFYAVPASTTWPSTAPGTFLKAQPVEVPGLAGLAWRVMYVSQADKGVPIAVTGYVVVPDGSAPAGGWPVVAWSHGTNGMADPCAPSLAIGHADLPVTVINAFLDRRWAFVASDYQGEGTLPGVLPYLVGASAAEDTINLVRAARSLPGAHTSSTWVEWGHSEGGQTAMFVDHLAPTYATGLHLLGVVAGAPPSQFAYIDGFLTDSPYAYYLVMVAFGFHAYYGGPTAPLSAVLTDAGKALLPDVTTKVTSAASCTSILADAVAPYVDAHQFSKLQRANPWSVPAWRTLLEENDPENFATASPVPLLIIQGGADEQVPVVTTQLLYAHLCGLKQVAQRWIYPHQSHAGVIGPSFNDMLHWMADRFAGVKNPDPYEPVGVRGVVPTAQSCN